LAVRHLHRLRLDRGCPRRDLDRRRIIYTTSYAKEASSRSLGFGIQAIAMIVLLLGAGGGSGMGADPEAIIRPESEAAAGGARRPKRFRTKEASI